MSPKKFALTEALVFEVVNQRVPMGTPSDKIRELEIFSRNFWNTHSDEVEAAIEAEYTRAGNLGVSFDVEMFMGSIEPVIVGAAPEWLNENPTPIYKGG